MPKAIEEIMKNDNVIDVVPYWYFHTDIPFDFIFISLN